MALGPGPAGLKFWTPQGIIADSTAADASNLPASVGEQFNPWGPRRPVQDWFLSTSSVLVSGKLDPITLTAAAGSYSIAGAAAGLAVNDPVNLPAGMTGHYVPWRRPYPVSLLTRTSGVLVAAEPVTLTAASGSYTITGTAAILALGHAAGSGSYSITGSAAALALGLGAGAGSYTITGTTAGLVIPGGLTAAAGSYALTGSDAALTVTTTVDTTNLPAGMTGSYVPWGRPFPVTLLTRTSGVLAAAEPVVLTAAGGSYTITGTTAALALGHVAGSGSYTITGATAGLTTPGALPAAAGSYTITGAAASLTVTTTADTANLPAGITSWFNPWRKPYPVSLLTRTGRPLAEVQAPVVLTAAGGSYITAGSSAALALRLTANSGSYTVSGTAAVLATRFAAGAGAYAILGTDAQLIQAGSALLTCAPGSYLVTGFSATLTVSRTTVQPYPIGGDYWRRIHKKKGKSTKRCRFETIDGVLTWICDRISYEAPAEARLQALDLVYDAEGVLEPLLAALRVEEATNASEAKRAAATLLTQAIHEAVIEEEDDDFLLLM